MDKHFTPSYTPPRARMPKSISFLDYGLNSIFIVGWWIYFAEISHALINIVDKGCYCDFSIPAAPCYGVYVILTEIVILLAVTVPLFVRFFRGLFIEQVGIGKKLMILLYSAILAAAVPFILFVIEESFAWIAPQTSLIEFTPWADADIMRIVRNRP